MMEESATSYIAGVAPVDERIHADVNSSVQVVEGARRFAGWRHCIGLPVRPSSRSLASRLDPFRMVKFRKFPPTCEGTFGQCTSATKFNYLFHNHNIFSYYYVRCITCKLNCCNIYVYT